jgi:C4-dicarboxylate transporter DctQ subunit
MSSPRLMFERASASVAYSAAAAGVLCVVVMMVMITFDVIARYVFNRPTMWADEMATYLMIAIVFLGLAQNLGRGDHIRIDVVTNLVPPHIRLFLEVFAHAVGIVFSAMLVVACWFRFDNFLVHKTTSDSPVMTELWIPMVPVLLGAVVFCLVMVAGFMTSFHALLNRDSGRTDEI